MLKKDLHDAELHSNAGIYLGNATVLELDTERVNRILAKIVMGLFYHEYGRICPEPEPWVEIQPDPRMTNHPVFAYATSGDPTILGDYVFAYWHRAANDDPDRVMWVMSFYDCILALGMSGPHQKNG